MKTLCITVLTVAFGLGSLALADTQDFTSPAGNLGPTHTYTLAGQPIIATGFCSGACSSGSDLFAKTGGGDENGLGLASDPSGQNEIFVGTDYIQIDVSALIAAGITTVQFSMGSTTAGEVWTVDACPVSLTLCANPVATGLDELVVHTISDLTAGTEFLDFTSNNGNVLLHNMSATAVPEPTSMIMFGTGLVSLAGLVRRKLRG